jgi:hypothetical protein
MKYIWALSVILLSTGLLASEQAVPVQPASDSNAWGDPLDGVQLRLAVSKSSPPPLPGELPGLEMQIRNVGSGYVSYTSDTVNHMSKIEIDGVWYGPIESAGNARSISVMPGARSTLIPLTFQTFLVELDANGQIGEPDANGKMVLFGKLDLKPGKHSVRVETSSGPWGVENSAHQVITLVSNTITVDVPGPPTAQEQALTNAISKMKSVLTDLPANVPELAVANVVAPDKNTVMAFYNPASNPNEAHGPSGVPIDAVRTSQRVTWFLTITIEPYDSEDEAQHGLELSERLTQVSPTQKQDLNGVTIYKWDQSGTYRVLFRVATSVVNIDTSRPEARPIGDKAFQILREVLGTN